MEIVHNKSWVMRGFLCTGFVAWSDSEVLAGACDYEHFLKTKVTYTARSRKAQLAGALRHYERAQTAGNHGNITDTQFFF